LPYLKEHNLIIDTCTQLKFLERDILCLNAL